MEEIAPSKGGRPLATRGQAFREGMRDGMPIGLGYFVVSFTLGIAARNAGLDPFQGFLASLLNLASAGEFAGFTVIAADAPYLEIAVITVVANARYLLMSAVVSQKFAPGTSFFHRLLVGFAITDEIFGITVARPGRLNPCYNYGAMSLAIPGWSVGTALGVAAGNVLPFSAVSALSVALYGMFLAVIIPPARREPIIGVLVLLSFFLSFTAAHLPGLMQLSSGSRVILLTVLISAIAAVFFPIGEEEAPHDA